MCKDSKPSSHRRVTLKDVARAAGVHVGTASKALSGTGAMTEDTRQRVRMAAADLGYMPDPMLGALAAYRKAIREEQYHGTLAWLLIDQHCDPVHYEAISLLKVECEPLAMQLGYRLEEFRLLGLPPGRMEGMLKARGIEGLLLPPMMRPGQKLDIDLSGFAAVAIGSSLAAPQLNRVQPYQFANIRLLVKALRLQGFRRIGFWLPKRLGDRTQGAYSAGFWLAQEDMPMSERLPICRPDDFDGTAFLEWFHTHQPDHLIGVPEPFNIWMNEAGLDPVPISFFGELPGETHGGLLLNENWPMICHSALRMLDGMLRHGDRGIPQLPRIVHLPGSLPI
jgi:LacI family transcriptional regulator